MRIGGIDSAEETAAGPRRARRERGRRKSRCMAGKKLLRGYEGKEGESIEQCVPRSTR